MLNEQVVAFQSIKQTMMQAAASTKFMKQCAANPKLAVLLDKAVAEAENRFGNLSRECEEMLQRDASKGWLQAMWPRRSKPHV